MGNSGSKEPDMTAASIEAYYAARAEKRKKDHSDVPKSQGEPRAEHSDDNVNVEGNNPDAQNDDDESVADDSNTSESPSTNKSGPLGGASLPGLPAIDPVRNVANLSGALDAATVHLTIAIRAASMQVHDALEVAIEVLRKMDLPTVAKAMMNWVKAHPWETAAILIPLILLACTPAILGAVGFTAGGIAAGSIAAGIQAGIGSVVAGSGFAILTSAAMAGYGVPIVFGSVWGISSAVLWGAAAWKKWRKDKNTPRITGPEPSEDGDQD